jgi:hypothetical protein
LLLRFIRHVQVAEVEIRKVNVHQLHPKTLEALAALVCADGTPEYRSAAEITRFLRRAESFFPDHDGQTSRRTWVLDLLHECNGSSDTFSVLDLQSLERVILQLAEPREYAGDYEVIQRILAQLNRILSVEGIVVSLDGARPQAKGIREHVVAPSSSPSQYVLPDFSRLTTDKVIANNLKMRWEEASRCIAAEAYLATVLLLGSILEGVLIIMLQAHPAEANRSTKSPKDGNGKAKTFREWSLHDCIEVACDCGWLHGDRLRFSHSLRQSRNLIHPSLQQMVGEWPNEHTCRICWEVVNAAIADLIHFTECAATD